MNKQLQRIPNCPEMSTFSYNHQHKSTPKSSYYQSSFVPKIEHRQRYIIRMVSTDYRVIDNWIHLNYLILQKKPHSCLHSGYIHKSCYFRLTYEMHFYQISDSLTIMNIYFASVIPVNKWQAEKILGYKISWLYQRSLYVHMARWMGNPDGWDK